MEPFHYAFFVRDLQSTRRFYGDILGCAEGRSTETWVDFDFFGNQISAHTGPVTPTHHTGQIEGIQVPMPHFGALLDWDAFSALADRIRASGIGFVLEPRIRYPGEPGEQATMFLLDPSGNALEFKSIRNPDDVFTALSQPGSISRNIHDGPTKLSRALALTISRRMPWTRISEARPRGPRSRSIRSSRRPNATPRPLS